jgi:uncharacterized coiled-coil protein SlyX/DNA-binding transcriptional regulator YhcF (GntR family)
MPDDISTQERAFSTKDIAVMVDIAEPTVRKYAQALEKAGYHFIKSENGTRTFIQFDAMVLRYLKELRGKTNMSVENASEIVAAKYNKKPIQSESLPDIYQNDQYDKRYDELEKRINEQNQIIETLVKTMKVHQDEFEKVSNRDKALMEAMREVQETKKLLIETQEKQQEDNKKTGFFSRLFGR